MGMDIMDRITLGKMQNPIRGLLHGLAAMAAVAGLAVMAVIGDVAGGTRFALVLYGASLVALFTTSSLYHSIPWSGRWKSRMRRLDHSAIFLVVAGSFTPFAVVALQGAWRAASLVVLWMAAVTGIIVKLSERRIRLGPSVTIQSAMGWAGLIPMWQIGRNLGADTVIWIGVGGALYTAGMVFMLTKWPKMFPRVFSYHELFHVMVVAAAAIHFVVIVTKVVPAA